MPFRFPAGGEAYITAIRKDYQSQGRRRGLQGASRGVIVAARMAVTAGARFGPYEIVAFVGEGATGDVYRARDTRLGREVAVKFLKASISDDPKALRRFELEARTAGALDHPNILAIHDVGAFAGAHYLVSELLEGQTLRESLRDGPLQMRKALAYGVQIARGLAAAHDKGVVHRDVKPENLFLTNDGRIKILDFGLAKLASVRGTFLSAVRPDGVPATEPGVVLGTVGYMSPEQVRGRLADHRSDIFAAGVVLYEMICGERPFVGDSTPEVLHAILKLEARDLAVPHPEWPRGLQRILQHCLEKSPEERLQSALDLAFQLEMCSGPDGEAHRDASASGAAVAGRPPADTSTIERVRPPPVRALRSRRTIALALLAFAPLGLVIAVHEFFREPPPPKYRQVTFRNGRIFTARFADDERTILYGAAWEGAPPRVFETRIDRPESTPLPFQDADLLAVSPSRELAIQLDRHYSMLTDSGTLGHVPVEGGAPHEILRDVELADFAGDSTLAAVHVEGGLTRVEFPLGHTLYETKDRVPAMRVSRKGDLVAFAEFNAGSIALLDRTGRKRTLATVTGYVDALAWSSSGNELWYTVSAGSTSNALFAVDLSGHQRVVTRAAIKLRLRDVGPHGSALVSADTARSGLAVSAAGDSSGERDLSWFDGSNLVDLSSNGSLVLFNEVGTAAEEFVYLRKTDGTPAVLLGKGEALALSPDGQWALTLVEDRGKTRLVALPTGPGEPRSLTPDGIDLEVSSARWFADGRSVVLVAQEEGHGKRLYVRTFERGVSEPITPEGIRRELWCAVAPDGSSVAAVGPDFIVTLYPVHGGAPRSLTSLGPDYVPVRWSADGRWLYVYKLGGLPAPVLRVDVGTGRSEKWRDLMPADPVGIKAIFNVSLTPDARAYAYGYRRVLSNLFVIEGLK